MPGNDRCVSSEEIEAYELWFVKVDLLECWEAFGGCSREFG